MKILFLPWSQPTHYLHMVPLAWAFRVAGAEVRVAGQPHVATAVQQSGLTVTCVGRDYDYLPGFQRITTEFASRSRQNPGGPGRPEPSAQARKKALEEKFAPFTKTAEAMAPELVALVQRWRPDLVVANPFVLAAPLVARAAGASLVYCLTGPAVERQLGFFPGSGAKPGLWTDDLRALYTRYEVEIQEEYAAGTVDDCPASLQFPGIPDRLPVRFVPYNGPGEIPQWLSGLPPRRRVCVTWGTTTTLLGGPDGFLVPLILKSLATFDVEAVVAINAADRALLGETGDHVHVVEDLPLHVLLPSCDAIIHQGGTGTMLTAASCGVPQVMIAAMLDQLTTATRVAAAGAGVLINAAEAEADSIASGISTVLSSEPMRSAAGLLMEEIAAQPTPAEVATTLAALADEPPAAGG